MPDIAPSIRSRIRVCGHVMRPLAAGALYWEDEDTLLVADLHLEKGAAFAALGMLLPPYDTRTTLQRLEKVINAVRPGRVVALGDSFHRSEGAARMADDDLALLTSLQKGREWYWICGNHDPHLPASIGGTICTTLTICGITLRHEPSATVAEREIAGHLHPVARIARRGAVIRRRCFATDGNRLVMPAFGAYAGGLNVLDRAFGDLFLRHRLEAWMMGRADVYPVLGSLLLPD
ncbi:ligase-associated DNA damage response endonuclease PdeM [Methyloceanibacter sp.]|uniref:ligase-associated DNA damage response endonuclease PdeM n=1 Tax=Methyloceanibacter sp. TaxID=1965321 RepID=UPI002D3FFA26|nr:ligase-associated DNA damage response endonuclease PdeM [Methyloceanibacter sp.]HZP09330.1 ligase-associated DNA damage response endonuclease PdeM [Methyloceanibacter sp.]